MKTVHSSAHNRFLVIKTKIELDSHADTCVVGDHCLVVHDHHRPVNVFGYNPKVASMHAFIVHATIAYTEPKTGQVVILSINQGIVMKGLHHHLLCSMQCWINDVWINEVPKFLAPILSKTMYGIQLENPFDAPHPIISPLKLSWME